MENKERVMWEGRPSVDYDPRKLLEYDSLIDEGIIKETHVNQMFSAEKGVYDIETIIEFLIPMHTHVDLPKPHIFRFRESHTGARVRKSDNAVRAAIVDQLIQLIAYSYMMKFIQDRDETSTGQ